jgi:hypothetical protein
MIKPLIFQCKFFRCTVEKRLLDPSEIYALEFKAEFCRFGICSFSATIVDDRAILETQRPDAGTARCENTVSVRSTIIRRHSPIASRQRLSFVQRLDSIGHDRRCLASSLHGRNKSMADDVPTWGRRTQWDRPANLLFESRTIKSSRTDQ